jgi:hypothetical protein
MIITTTTDTTTTTTTIIIIIIIIIIIKSSGTTGKSIYLLALLYNYTSCGIFQNFKLQYAM